MTRSVLISDTCRKLRTRRQQKIDSRQRTSTRSGVLKADAVTRAALALAHITVETAADLRTLPPNQLAAVAAVWQAIPGQRSFSGSRALSHTSERRAQQGVAVSFWLLAPYIAVQSCCDLATREHATVSQLGIAVTVSSIVVMPLLGRAKRRLGDRLDSAATAGEGNQNLLCAEQAAAVLAGLAANAWTGAYWLDGVIGLGLAAVAMREGRAAWRGDACC